MDVVVSRQEEDVGFHPAVEVVVVCDLHLLLHCLLHLFCSKRISD